MANEEHLEILKQGVDVWNRWREENPEVRPELSRARLRESNLVWVNLRGAYLRKANLSHTILNGAMLEGAVLQEAKLDYANLHKALLRGADLQWADLQGAILSFADLNSANLQGASLAFANLDRADLQGADLKQANLGWADLRDANLNQADLRNAHVSEASLVRTSLERADLSGSCIYGISAWDLKLAEANQRDLVITPHGVSNVTVDDIEVAQFVYLILNNEKIRRVIDTISSKAVLILGRFTEERKAVLDAMRGELRNRDYLPILFDFEKPDDRDLTETVSTLAHMSRFVIADVTDAKSIPQELQAIVPDLPSVPVRLLVQKGAREYAMIGHFKRYPWVIDTYQYDDTPQLLATLAEEAILPAERKVEELREEK